MHSTSATRRALISARETCITWNESITSAPMTCVDQFTMARISPTRSSPMEASRAARKTIATSAVCCANCSDGPSAAPR